MDLTKLGLILAIILFVLSFPLGIVGNLLAPKLGDWYSTSSQRKLRARIRVLRDRLNECERWTFTDAEWFQHETQTRFFRRLYLLIYYACLGIWLILLVPSHHFTKTEVPFSWSSLFAFQQFDSSSFEAWNTVGEVGLWMMLVGLAALWCSATTQFRRRYARLHTPFGRAELSKQIADLESKLGKNSIKGVPVS